MKVILKAILSIVSLTVVVLIVLVSIDPFLLLRGMDMATPYKTQSIQYRKIDDPNVRVEFQMKDVGGRGYLKRTVLVEPGLLWDSVYEIELEAIDLGEWHKVDEYVNEHELKGG